MVVFVLKWNSLLGVLWLLIARHVIGWETPYWKLALAWGVGTGIGLAASRLARVGG